MAKSVKKEVKQDDNQKFDCVDIFQIKENQEEILTPELIEQKINEIEESKKSLKKELDDKMVEFEKQEFEFGDAKMVELAIKYLGNNAPWKFSECIYISSALEELGNVINQEPKEKYGLTNKILDTINHFMSVTEGIGIDLKTTNKLDSISFYDFIDLFNAVQNSLRLTEEFRTYTKTVKDKMEIYNHMIHSWKVGINPGDMITPYEEQLKSKK